MALPKQNRLKKRKDFEEVFKKGKTLHGDFLFIKYNYGTTNISRFGIVVSAKVAKKAVLRNRIRRILSETIRGQLKTKQQKFYDVVIFIKKTIPEDLNSVKNDLLTTLRKAKII